MKHSVSEFIFPGLIEAGTEKAPAHAISQQGFNVKQTEKDYLLQLSKM